MAVAVHNPDQYMAAFRTLAAQGRKRIGLLIGAGGPAGMQNDAGGALIPAVAGLTKTVIDNLSGNYGAQFAALKAELGKEDIEAILSRIRTLSGVLGTTAVHGLDGPAYKAFGDKICGEIGQVVKVGLPIGTSAYSELTNWITGVSRDHPVEIFTTNYDLLFEEAFERVRAPYFDGFTGGREAFFDPVSVAGRDLPPRWTRLWKLHGSLGWKANARGEVIRTGQPNVTHLVFPEHLKYDQTQKAPYSALLDRLRAFLSTPDSLLVALGFSFADAHVAARIDEGLAACPSSGVFAFQFRTLAEETYACDIAARRPNFSVYARDAAVINGVPARWETPLELPTRDWGPIRKSYWEPTTSDGPPEFKLGAITDFARFLASSRSTQAWDPPPAAPTAHTSDPAVIV